MQLKTVKKLNQLNLDFYTTVSDSFDATRQQPWNGWATAIENINTNFAEKQNLSILDIGAGNGRWYQAIREEIPVATKLSYTAIDSNKALLDTIPEKILPEDIHKNIHLDLVEQLLEKKPFSNTKHDVIVLFGVWHHIPSQNLRLQLLNEIKKLAHTETIFIFTAWQFIHNPNLMKRITTPEKINLEPDELEQNDYLLDWQRGKSALRYCHYSSIKEVANLLEKSNWQLNNHYLADGKDDQQNAYFICSPKN